MDRPPVDALQPETPPPSIPVEAMAPAAGVPMAVRIRSFSLAAIAVLAVLYIMRWASAIIVPVLLGWVFSHALRPLVDRLERLRLPRALAAGVVLLTLVTGLGATAYSLADDASSLLQTLPVAAQKVKKAVAAHRAESGGALAQVQKAALQLEQAAAAGPVAAPSPGATRVVIERPHFNLQDYLWSGTLGVITSVGQAIVVLFITFFLLAAGSQFRRKLAHLAGPTFARRRLTVQALDEIGTLVQRHLMVQVMVSATVGVTVWLSFTLIGMEHAAVWGASAFVLDFIPYVGATILAITSGLMSFVQFGNVDMVLVVAGTVLAVHTISGNLLMPWLSSRNTRMNAVTVFIGVLAFGWLWGLMGLLLAVPILASVKAVCDRVEELKPVGELMGR